MSEEQDNVEIIKGQPFSKVEETVVISRKGRRERKWKWLIQTRTILMSPDGVPLRPGDPVEWKCGFASVDSFPVDHVQVELVRKPSFERRVIISNLKFGDHQVGSVDLLETIEKFSQCKVITLLVQVLEECRCVIDEMEEDEAE